MIACLLRVCWAATAGQLHLATASSSNTGDVDPAGLYLGICALLTDERQLGTKDVLIACQALELLVTCLEVKGQAELEAFYSFPCVKGNF